MRAMTILRRCREAADELRRYDQRIRQRREAMGVSGVQMDPNGGSRGGGDPDRMGRMMADLDLIERAKADREDARKAEVASAVLILDMLPELESGILHRYYILRESTGEIARKEKYEASYVRKKKRDGEEALGLIRPERIADTLPRWYLERWPDEA